MVGSAHFSSMDFKSGFWQIKMVQEPQQYTAFTVGNLGFYEFTHMLFGLCNAPMTFQHLMQNTLGELNLMYCVIYLDDVIVFGHMEGEHLECLCIEFGGSGSLTCSSSLQSAHFSSWNLSTWLITSRNRAFCQAKSHEGIPNARDLHPGPRILWTGRALLEVYQGIRQHSTPLV